MHDTIETKNTHAASGEADAFPREIDLAEIQRRTVRRREAFALLLADSRRGAMEYVENYTAGRGAE